MPTTDNLGIPELEPGQASKDVTVNSALNQLDHVIAGVLSKAVAGSGDFTLSISPDGGEAANSKIYLTGTRTGSGNIILPKITRIWRVINNTTGAYTLTIKGSTGTGVAMGVGDDFFVRFDGTNFIKETVAPYIVGVQGLGIPTPAVPIIDHIFSLSVVFRAGLPNTSFKAATAATSSAVFTIYKTPAGGSPSSVGTMTFASSGTIPTFSFSADVTFGIGDELTVLPPGSADATLAGISGSFRGER
jgi:hypothetical protein